MKEDKFKEVLWRALLATIGEAEKHKDFDSDEIELQFIIRATFDPQSMLHTRVRASFFYDVKNKELTMKKDGGERIALWNF